MPAQEAAVDTTIRTYVQLVGSHQALHCVDRYSDVLDRIEAVRTAALKLTSKQMGNPLGANLVHVRMVISLGDEGSAVVDAAFNPLHVLCMYRAHPDV